jgi:hypothetical protein
MAKRMELPNGAKVHTALSMGAPVTITAITNANPAVVTAASHGLTAGDYVIINSPWCELDGRAFRVGVTDVDTFTLIGADTSDTTDFSPGGGAGSFQEVVSWTEVPCVTEINLTGGEAQWTEVGCLQEQKTTRLFNGFSPIDWQMSVVDLDGNPAIERFEEVTKSQEPTVTRITLKSGKVKLYPGIHIISQDSTMARGEVMVRTLNIAVTDITKYPAP